MKRVPLVVRLAVVCALAASGCARAVVTTNVNVDGSWTRALRFQGGSKLGDLKDYFVLPNGAPWTTRKEWIDEEAVYNAQRVLPAGQVLRQDLVVKGTEEGSQGRRLVNEVSVREVAPGKIEYREVLRWQGRRPKEIIDPDPWLLQALESALPPTLATEADAREVAQTVLREYWRIRFGPGDPIIASMQYDLAVRRAKRQLGIAVDRALQEKFGERMTLEQRRTVARVWGAAILEAARKWAGTRGKPSGPVGWDRPTGVALTFAARLPGRVVSTNGELDEITGEVFWGLYSEAPAAEDVVMTATCEVGASRRVSRLPGRDLTSDTEPTATISTHR